MKEFKKYLIPLSFMLSIPIVNIFYGILNNADRGVSNLVTRLDDSIPFIKVFVIPYMFWYPFMILTMVYFCVKDRKTYVRSLISINISLIVCYVIFYFYQTTVPRPELLGNDFLTRFVGLVYGSDKPYNCFPSIHVLTCYIMMIAVTKSTIRNLWIKLLVYSISAVIIISTLYIKQHVVLDVIGGIFVGDIIYRFVYIIDWESAFAGIKKFFNFLFFNKKLKANKNTP
ncbi:MAG: phosphatase PAP2 family protein [Clostridia bacterium]|nr:phosphatase PAP2 family protein [Clostridia bacterium]